MKIDSHFRFQWKYIAIYYAIACGVSWTFWAPLVLGQDGLQWIHIGPYLPIIGSAGTVGPLLACFLTHRIQTGDWRAVRLFPQQRLRMSWLLLGPMLILFCYFFVFPALLSEWSPDEWHWHVPVLAGILVPMFNYNLFGGPLFEEFGWRGFLQVRLQEVLPPWIAAICVGLMWAAWHLPLFLIPRWSSALPPVFFLLLIGLSMTMAFGFNASGESVAVAILMHSAFNSSPRFFTAYLNRAPTPEYPSAELILGISFLLVGAALAVLTLGCLAADSS